MIARPPTEHADDILGASWPAGSGLEALPADLSGRALALSGLAARLTAVSEDGQVGAEQLLNYGQGAFAEAASAAWVKFFASVAVPAAQAADSAAALESWAASVGGLLAALSEIVWRTEELIEVIRAEAAASGVDPQSQVQALISEAQGEVTAVEAAVMGAIAAALPAWAGTLDVPAVPATFDDAQQRGVLPAPQEAVQEPPRGVLPSPQEAPAEQPSRGVLPVSPAASRGVLPAPREPVASDPPPVQRVPAVTSVQPAPATPAAPTPSTVGTPGGPPLGTPPPSASGPAVGSAASATPPPPAIPPTQASPGSPPPAAPPLAVPPPVVAPVVSAAVPPLAIPSLDSPPAGEVSQDESGLTHDRAAVPMVAAPAPPAPASPVAPPATVAGPATAVSPPVMPQVPPTAVAPPVSVAQGGSGLVPPPPIRPVPDRPAALPVVAAAVERGAGIVPPQLPAGGEVELLHRIVWGLGGAGQVSYAAAVIEIAGGRQVVLTSDRGRGWLPAGALVPVAAVNPWTHRAAAAWIGVADPVRVLTEYAAAVGGELAAVVATRGQLPAGVAAERAEAREVAHATLTVPTCGRVAWQAGDLAATVERWPARDDLHRQAMGCAWLAHTSAPDPRGRRAAVLDAIFTRHHAGMRGDPRMAVTGWEPLWQRWSAASVAEARARYDATQVPVGALDGTAAAEHSPQLAVLLADEATLALRQPGPAALEAALYAAAMCRAT